ncbi:MAG: EAL domain-containing protein [Gammaproteobacteria bacterium]|nr:EAL domain-containing protein [Gammaproteobacteria bacterium]
MQPGSEVSSNSSDKSILYQQLEMLLQNTRTTNIGNLLIAGLAYLVLMTVDVDKELLMLWLVSLSSFVVLRYIAGRQYQHLGRTRSPRYYLRQYTLTSMMIGINWGLLPVLQFYSNDHSSQNFVFMVVVGIVAASVISLSVWLSALISFIIPQMIGLVSVLLMENNTISIMTAIGFTVYTLIISYVGRNFNCNIRENLLLQNQHINLINELSNEVNQRNIIQKQLEQHKDELEETVKHRTRELSDSNLNLKIEINERRKAIEDLHHLAHHDPLTDLPNRVLLIDRLKHAISVANRNSTKIGLLFLDLDRFKKINDSLGHSTGDAVLLDVAERIKGTLRDSDTIARNGGDEFVIIFEGISNSDSISLVAEKVIAAITQTFNISGHEIHIGTSIGISIYPDDGEDPITLLKHADTAMYQAKQKGGNSFKFYSEEMSKLTHQRLILESKLHSAIDNKEFYVVYQPQVDLNSGSTIGYEALMRWQNPDLGLVPPDKFIPLLEDTGLIYQSDEWLIHHVIDFIKSGKPGNAKISVNLSALQCNRLNFVDFIEQTIKDNKIIPSQLEFEITESLLIENLDQSTKFLQQLHNIGCSIALDDFGTGYTSMRYLTCLPIDIIKIDRSFVTNIEHDESLRSIVQTILSMTNSLELSHVIEGVETESQLDVIRKLGGYIIQGYLFSKPLAEYDVEQWQSDLDKQPLIENITSQHTIRTVTPE